MPELAQLSPATRDVVVLGLWGGYPQAEVARLTGVSLDTVRTRMLDGLRDISSTALRRRAWTAN